MDAWLDELAQAAGGFEGRSGQKDVVVDTDDIVSHNRALYAKVLSKFQRFDDPVASQTAVVVLLVYRLRLVDMSMKEYVHIIHAIEGDKYLRAHNGTLYLYSDGAWKSFCGIFPVSVLTRVRRVLSLVEGFLRLLPAGTPREESAVLDALEASIARAGGMTAWTTGAELSAMKGGQPRDGEITPWSVWVASSISKVRATATNLLCGRKCVPFLIEWCETPIEKRQGFACKDACFIFNEDLNWGNVLRCSGESSFGPHTSYGIIEYGSRGVLKHVLAGKASVAKHGFRAKAACRMGEPRRRTIVFVDVSPLSYRTSGECSR